jgi:hypothetical protein
MLYTLFALSNFYHYLYIFIYNSNYIHTIHDVLICTGYHLAFSSITSLMNVSHQNVIFLPEFHLNNIITSIRNTFIIIVVSVTKMYWIKCIIVFTSIFFMDYSIKPYSTPRLNIFYGIYDIINMVNLLAFTNINILFLSLLPLQVSMYTYLHMKKGYIKPLTWHVIYILSILSTYIYIIYFGNITYIYICLIVLVCIFEVQFNINRFLFGASHLYNS